MYQAIVSKTCSYSFNFISNLLANFNNLHLIKNQSCKFLTSKKTSSPAVEKHCIKRVLMNGIEWCLTAN